MPVIPSNSCTEEEAIRLLTKKGLSSLVTLFVEKYFNDHEGEIPDSGLYHRIINAVERPLLESTLKLMKYNQKQAAVVLGINRNTLRKKIQEFKIMIPEVPKYGE